MKRLIILIISLSVSVLASGQNERKHVRSGNKLFLEAVGDTTKIDSVKFSNAETEYRKALNKKPNDEKWNFNLADAIYKQQRFEEAAGKFEELAEKMTSPEEKARAFHNMGNSQFMNQKIDESIETYKKALRENPNDLDTKYNLAYAQMLKKKQEEQQQQQQDQDQDQDQNKDQDKQDQDKQDQNKDQQDQNKDQENKDQQNQDQQNQQNKEEQQQQQQQPQNKISKENAEQLLQVLENDEKKIQDKVKKAKAAAAKKSRTEKEW